MPVEGDTPAPNERIALLEGQLQSVQTALLPWIRSTIESTQEDVKLLADKTAKDVEPIKRIRFGVWAVGTLLLLFGTTFAAFLPFLYAKITTLTQKTTELEGPIKEWDKKVAESEKKIDEYVQQQKPLFIASTRQEILKSLPIGTILAYHPAPNQNLPDGWMYCDDSEVTDEESPFIGTKVPNLNGRMLRGREGNEQLGDTAGEDLIPPHATMPDGEHKHSFQDPARSVTGRTGKIISDPPIPEDQMYAVRNQFGHWKKNEPYYLRMDSDEDQWKRGTGQHRHEIANGDASAKSAGKVFTDAQGTHSHQIESLPFVPKYLAVEFIIRVK